MPDDVVSGSGPKNTADPCLPTAAPAPIETGSRKARSKKAKGPLITVRRLPVPTPEDDEDPSAA